MLFKFIFWSGDKRFTFLEPGHQFHVYYESKLAYFISLEEPPKASPKLTKPTSEVLSDSEPVKDENSQEHALNEPEDSDSDSETEDSCDSRSRHKPGNDEFHIFKFFCSTFKSKCTPKYIWED